MEIFILIVMGLSIVGVGVIGFILYKDSQANKIDKNKVAKNKTGDKKEKAAKEKDNIQILDSRDLMEFKGIAVCNNEHALIDCYNNKFIGVIEVGGINFNLLSTDERLLLEENFQSLLNGIDYPIQICIQAQKVDLDNYIYKYDKRLEEIKESINILVNKKRNSATAEDEKGLDIEIQKLTSRYNYGQKLKEYFINRTIDSELLNRKYYILVKYEHNRSLFETELDEYEILSQAYSEITNKVSVIADSLGRDNLNAKLINGIELGEFLMNFYNKEDAAQLKFRNVVKSKYNHLVVTAKPIERKLVEHQIKELEIREKEILDELSKNNTKETQANV